MSLLANPFPGRICFARPLPRWSHVGAVAALMIAMGTAADAYLRARSLPYAAHRRVSAIVMPGQRHPGVRLPGANLAGAQLRGADLTGAHLQGATFGGACLAETRLRDADLRAAGLVMTDLTAADLASADLRGASLRGAHLFGADLSTARLEGVDLTAACFDEGTAWPRGFNPRAHGAFYLPEPPHFPSLNLLSED